MLMKLNVGSRLETGNGATLAEKKEGAKKLGCVYGGGGGGSSGVGGGGGRIVLGKEKKSP